MMECRTAQETLTTLSEAAVAPEVVRELDLHLAECASCRSLRMQKDAPPERDWRDEATVDDTPLMGDEGQAVHEPTAATWQSRFVRSLAWAGSFAMRPQFAMGALFVFVICSSLLLLRARQTAPEGAPLRVSERGIPNPDPVPSSVASVDEARSALVDAPKRRRADEGEGRAQLAQARADRDRLGCGAALAKYEALFAHGDEAVSLNAKWEAAECERLLGHLDTARKLFKSLAFAPAFRERAQEELDRLESAPTTEATADVAATASGLVPKPTASSP